MALKFNYTSAHGATFTDAYARITSVSIQTPLNDQDNHMVVGVAFYVDESARNHGLKPIGTQVFRDTYDEQTQQFDKTSLYNWLKTQPMFENATDA